MVSYNEFCHAGPSLLVFSQDVKFSRVVGGDLNKAKNNYFNMKKFLTTNTENILSDNKM